MTHFAWQELMQQWNQAAFADAEWASFIPKQARASRWLGYSGATDADIAATEARLGMDLPPSYRSFLKYSNGWMLMPTSAALWSTHKIVWFADSSQDIIDIWTQEDNLTHTASFTFRRLTDEEYLVYGEGQHVFPIRGKYLQTSLEISDLGDSAIYLLNPQIITQEGEWEAWMFATWLPGARRYRSFWDLMQAEYERFIRKST